MTAKLPHLGSNCRPDPAQRRAAAPAPDRTLDVQIADLPAGAEIWIELTSRHVDVSTGDYHRAVKGIVLPDRACTVESMQRAMGPGPDNDAQ